MGIFYNPPSDVIEGKVGRELPVIRDHTEALAYLQEGEHLYIGLSRIAFWAVGCIDEAGEFAAASKAIDNTPEVRMFALDEAAHNYALGVD